MLHIAICDDDAWMASKVEALAKIFFRTHCVDIKVQSYQSSENLMYDLQDGVYYDLLLLDIEMPGIDGMGQRIFMTICRQRESFLSHPIWSMRLLPMSFLYSVIFLRQH